MMDAAQREAQVRRFVDQVWNRLHYEAAGELYADHYSNPLGTGPSAKTDGMRRYHQALRRPGGSGASRRSWRTGRCPAGWSSGPRTARRPPRNAGRSTPGRRTAAPAPRAAPHPSCSPFPPAVTARARRYGQRLAELGRRGLLMSSRRLPGRLRCARGVLALRPYSDRSQRIRQLDLRAGTGDGVAVDAAREPDQRGDECEHQADGQAVSHDGTPEAMRIGISVGLNSGMIDSTASKRLPGLLGRSKRPARTGRR